MKNRYLFIYGLVYGFYNNVGLKMNIRNFRLFFFLYKGKELLEKGEKKKIVEW